jgi:hypothetical protein
MLPFKLPVVNQQFPHNISELGVISPVVVKDQINSFDPNGPHSDSFE